MTLPESALLAGLIQRPEALTPYRHRERALKRRNHVIGRMLEEGYLNPKEAAEAREAPIRLSGNRTHENIAPYFVEEVRRWLKSKYGDSSVYQAGLEVHTTLDPVLQRLANRAMDYGLRQLDKRQGWRGISLTVPAGEDPAVWESPTWQAGILEGRVLDGVVLAVDGNEATVRVGPHAGILGKDEIAWTRRKKPSSFLSPGDVLRVRMRSIEDDGSARLSLEQEPLAEAALVAIDPSTGEVRAMVGGFDFERSEWNRVTQAKRQTGSAFKPFVYAAALASGWNLADRIMDEPTVFLDPYIGEPYQPENYTNKYYGNLTLRRALEKSANIATVKLLHQVGYQRVIEVAHKVGIQSRLHPFPSLALGSFEVSLMELTSAYGTFANQGVRVDPHLVNEVRDRDGALLERVEPQVHDALSPQIAYLVNHCLEGVVTDGTGRAAASIGRPLAGKTGTTDDNTDAWFIGYTPDLAVGVWVGFDDNSSLGSRETGALAALPIWKHFMQSAYRDRPVEEFDPPHGVTFLAIDRETGLKANPSAECRPVYSEAFVEGTEPTKYCSRHDHFLRSMPYPLQRYRFNEQGSLEISEAELAYLLSTDLSFHLNRNGRRIVARGPERSSELSLEITPGGSVTVVPDRLRNRLSDTEWFGKDGRRARIILLER
jgi:penicillin-binding protein 1A